MKVEVGDVVMKKYSNGIFICEIVGVHEEWDEMYEIDILFSTINDESTKNRDESDNPVFVAFYKYRDEKLLDWRG